MRNKLKDSQIKSFSKPGRYSDGDGLYISVSKSGSRSWVFMYNKRGRRREMGLGSYGSGAAQVSLAQARVKAEEIRSILGDGGDPFVELAVRTRFRFNSLPWLISFVKPVSGRRKRGSV